MNKKNKYNSNNSLNQDEYDSYIFMRLAWMTHFIFFSITCIFIFPESYLEGSQTITQAERENQTRDVRAKDHALRELKKMTSYDGPDTILSVVWL